MSGIEAKLDHIADLLGDLKEKVDENTEAISELEETKAPKEGLLEFAGELDGAPVEFAGTYTIEG